MRAFRWLANLKGHWLLLFVVLLQYLTHRRVHSTAPVAAQQMQLAGKCSLKGSCTRELTSRRLDLDSSVGSQKLACYCDQKCAQFDDCCQDARWTDRLEARVQLGPAELQARRHQWQCKRINPIFGDVLVRAACPADWLTSGALPQAELIKKRCEYSLATNHTTPADWIQSDPTGSLMPITDLLTGITYANSYCLRCNSNQLLSNKTQQQQKRKLIYWTPLVSCAYNPEADDRNDLYDLISSKRGQALRYSASKRSWYINTQALSLPNRTEAGVSSRLKSTSELDDTERACTMVPTIPDSIEHMIRHCKLNTIDWCPPAPEHKLNVSGVQLEELRRARHECQFGHQSLVYSQTSDAIYFNLACAKCHQEERLFCEPRVRKEFGISRYALPGNPLEGELPPADLATGAHSRSGGQPATPISGSFTVLMDLYGGFQGGGGETNGGRGEAHNNSGGGVGGEADDQLVGAVHQCEDAEWQVYDPILLTCRDIVCGLNHKFVDGSCVLVSGGDSSSQLGELHEQREDNNNSANNKTVEFMSESKVNSASSSAPSRALDRPVAALEQVAPSSSSNGTELGQEITTTTTSTANTTASAIDQETREIFARLKLDELPLASAKSRRSFAECAKILVSSEHYRLFTLTQLQQFKRSQQVNEQQQVTTTTTINKTNDDDIRWPLSLATQESSPPSWAFVLPYNLTLASSQFELVRAPSGGAGSDQFKLLVCSPFKSDLVDKFKAPMVYLTTCCLAISIASLVAYLLLYALSTFDLRHLVIEMTQAGQHELAGHSMGVDSKCRGSRASDQTSYNAVRSQSLSSRGVACLALALLAAYLLFILGHQQQQETDRKRQVELPEVEAIFKSPSGPTWSCRLIAAATYCSFLLAFNWMFLLSYDIWRTLRLATCQLRAPVMSSQSGRFLVYAALAISSASAITLIALLIDQLEPLSSQSTCQPPTTTTTTTWWAQKLDKFAQVYRPKFGQRAGSCWFANRRSLALFFGLPVTLIMFTNLIFFLHSSYMVIKTSSRSSRRLAATNSSSSAAKTPSFLTVFSTAAGNPQVADSQVDFAQQNSLTTSSISSVRTIQSSLSIESAINDNNTLNNSSEDDDEPAPPPPPPRDGATSHHFEHASVGKQLSSNSLLSVSNQSDKSNASSLASSLAHKYDLHLNNLSAFMSSIGKDYRLYCRLSTIMGLTWLTGLMASIVDQSDILWYLFVLLNTLQGLFIFIAFGFKRSRLTNLEILFNYLTFKLKRAWAAGAKE